MERRAALEAAFDKLEAGDDVEQTTPESEKIEPEVKQVEAPEGGEKPPKEAPTDPVVSGGDKPPKEEKPAKDPALERAAKAAADSGNDGLKAPVSWKPAAKAEWAKLPLDIKNEVLRREKEMSQYISQTDFHKKFTQDFANVIRPFEHLIRQENSTPLQAVKNMMVTAAGLKTGNKLQKAQIISEIIRNHDVDIETLDNVLSGKAGFVKPGGDDISPSLMKMFQPVYSFMDEVKQARTKHEAVRQEQADKEVQEFMDKPYFEDVRDEMADIIEIASKRGVQMTLQQAYDKAIALNPEISAIIAREKEAEKAREAGTRLAKAKKVASTIVGAPAGGADNKPVPKSRREQLEAAWDDATQH